MASHDYPTDFPVGLPLADADTPRAILPDAHSSSARQLPPVGLPLQAGRGPFLENDMAYEIECTMQPHGRYVAHVVDHEGEGPKGEGETKTEALCELIEGLLDARSDAIGMAFGALVRTEADSAGEHARHGMERAARAVEGVF